MSEEKERAIPEGTIVVVGFADGSQMNGVEFVRGPQGPGDCFVVRNPKTGKVSYIGSFETITQKEEP